MSKNNPFIPTKKPVRADWLIEHGENIKEALDQNVRVSDIHKVLIEKGVDISVDACRKTLKRHYPECFKNNEEAV